MLRTKAVILVIIEAKFNVQANKPRERLKTYKRAVDVEISRTLH